MNKTLNPYQRLTNRPSRSIKGWFWSIRVGLLSSFSSIKAEQERTAKDKKSRLYEDQSEIGPVMPIPAPAHLMKTEPCVSPLLHMDYGHLILLHCRTRCIFRVPISWVMLNRLIQLDTKFMFILVRVLHIFTRFSLCFIAYFGT